MADTPFDVVVFGATSFVGRILTRRLVERVGTDGEVRWAIAGRDPARLEEVATETGADVPRIVADAHDRPAMDDLAASTRVVVSTVGPYAQHGSDLVAAVAAAGTDYADLTGEPHWMRRMIDAHQATAEQSGARIVHACGFDSVPSDLGVWFTQQVAEQRYGVACERIGLRVKGARGGASGGTVASMLNLMEEASGDAELRRILADPYALAPEAYRHGPSQRDVVAPQFDSTAREWVAPWIMAATNSRVVHRTHALLGRPWGEDFRYDEAIATGRGPLGLPLAGAIAAGTAWVAGAAAFGPTRSLLERFLPSPGEGPSPEAQESGSFDLRLHGRTPAGQRVEVAVHGDRDPGYGSTARMLCEAALAFADVDRDRVGGGFWTPATAFGGLLVDRLAQHAGVTFEAV